jgi:hypothetical protein
MKKIIIILIAMVLSSILLWYSGDRNITAEEIAMIDTLWVSHYERNIKDSHSIEKSVSETKIKSKKTVSMEDCESETPDGSTVTSSLRSSISKIVFSDTN